MNRRKARESAFNLIFQHQFCKDELIDELEFYKEHNETDEHVENVFIKTYENIQQIDDIISKHLTNWSIDRISKVSISILRLAVYEIMFTDIPDSVSVNEAVELAKRFSDSKAPSFINGILGKIVAEKSTQ